ncbi:MAG: M48 family metalloprotease [Betaproteobacteria bacterium]|nr:M48 family metalloprotease [Betaproteobacteria bacterium]
MAILACTATLACVSPTVRPLSDGDPRVGESEAERKLLADAGRLREELDRKGLLFGDAKVLRYVEGIAGKVIPANTSALVAPRLRLLRSPAVNAFALPNGDIYLTIGLLSHLRNEAQLAMVLAHEFAHVEMRHGLRAYENRRTSIMAAHIADLFLLGTSLAYLPFMASVSQFSRDQEREADRLALERMVAAGFDPTAAIAAFDVLRAVEHDDAATASAYSSHPSNRERAEELQALVATLKPGQASPGQVGEAEFRAARRALLQESARLSLRAGRYALAFRIGEDARRDFPDAAWPVLAEGEARRLMAQDPKGAANEEVRRTGRPADAGLVKSYEARRDQFLAQARQHFGEALRLEPGSAEAERGLGLIHAMSGDAALAAPLLKAYLEKRPNAPDRLYIADIVKKGKPP